MSALEKCHLIIQSMWITAWGKGQRKICLVPITYLS